MKLILILTLVVASSYARYTLNSGSQLNMLQLFSSTTNSDPKLKEGVINWIKDQVDPKLVKTWYKLSKTERMCVQRGLVLAKQQIDDEKPKEAMDFIDSFCSSAADSAEKLYTGLREYAKKMKEYSDSFMEDLPESIKEPMEKIMKRSKWLSLTNGKEETNQIMYEMFDAIEQILNAPQADRETLAQKHTFLAPFVTGDVRDDTIRIAQAIKKVSKKENIENAFELVRSMKNWMKSTKAQLLSYFETRERPENLLPEEIDKQFTDEIGLLYDVIYSVYAEPFQTLWRLDTEVGESEEDGEDKVENETNKNAVGETDGE